MLIPWFFIWKKSQTSNWTFCLLAPHKDHSLPLVQSLIIQYSIHGQSFHELNTVFCFTPLKTLLFFFMLYYHWILIFFKFYPELKNQLGLTPLFQKQKLGIYCIILHGQSVSVLLQPTQSLYEIQGLEGMLRPANPLLPIDM